MLLQVPCKAYVFLCHCVCHQLAKVALAGTEETNYSRINGNNSNTFPRRKLYASMLGLGWIIFS